MATVLHVQASPRGEESFSARVARAFLDRYRRRHPDARTETLCVFGEELPEFAAPAAAAKYAVLGGAEPTDDAARAWAAVVQVVDRLKAADMLLISCPMWNFSVPYRLKQWIDVIVQPGLTFSYDPQAGYQGLLSGRTAVLVLARGSDYSGELAPMDMQRPYLEAILRFLGITDVHAVTVEPTMAAGPETAEGKLRQAVADAEALAETL
jgi:FMN-dependent NADH-azoreductase